MNKLDKKSLLNSVQKALLLINWIIFFMITSFIFYLAIIGSQYIFSPLTSIFLGAGIIFIYSVIMFPHIIVFIRENK